MRPTVTTPHEDFWELLAAAMDDAAAGRLTQLQVAMTPLTGPRAGLRVAVRIIVVPEAMAVRMPDAYATIDKPGEQS